MIQAEHANYLRTSESPKGSDESCHWVQRLRIRIQHIKQEVRKTALDAQACAQGSDKRPNTRLEQRWQGHSNSRSRLGSPGKEGRSSGVELDLMVNSALRNKYLPYDPKHRRL